MKYVYLLTTLQVVSSLPLLNQIVAEGIADISSILKTIVHPTTGEAVITVREGYNSTESLTRAVQELGAVEDGVEITTVRIEPSIAEFEPDTYNYNSRDEWGIDATIYHVMMALRLKQNGIVGPFRLKQFHAKSPRGGQTTILGVINGWFNETSIEGKVFASTQQHNTTFWGQDAWVYHYTNAEPSKENQDKTVINSIDAVCLNNRWCAAVWWNCEANSSAPTLQQKNTVFSYLDQKNVEETSFSLDQSTIEDSIHVEI